MVTVFTPSYNRASKIHRVFNSLLRQTYRDFEWVIVDDGSTDDTRLVIESFVQQAPFFPIKYHYQENGGKHTAINQGVRMAAGEWFHIADSDDEIYPETLETFIETWQSIPGSSQKNYCGILACCENQRGKRISNQVPGGFFDGYLRDLFYKHRFRAEFFHIFRTDKLKEFPFPENLRRLVIPEGIFWRKMATRYRILAIDKVLRIYFMNESTDALMYRKDKSPQSKALTNCFESSNILNADLRYFIYWPIHFMKMGLLYHTFKHYLDEDAKKYVPLNARSFLFSLPFMFPGFIFSHILNARFKTKTK